MTAALFLY